MTGTADRAKGQLQLLRLAILSGDVSRQRERGPHRAPADDARRGHAAQAAARRRADGDSEIIIAPGDMLIFVSGHFPILGMQMLYFLDPVLTGSAAIKPPTEFLALEDGQPVRNAPSTGRETESANPKSNPSIVDPESAVGSRLH